MHCIAAVVTAAAPPTATIKFNPFILFICLIFGLGWGERERAWIRAGNRNWLQFLKLLPIPQCQNRIIYTVISSRGSKQLCKYEKLPHPCKKKIFHPFVILLLQHNTKIHFNFISFVVVSLFFPSFFSLWVSF